MRALLIRYGLVSLLGGAGLSAQDLGKLLPESVPPQVAPVDPSQTVKTMAASGDFGAQPGEEQLIPALIQVVFSPTPEIIPPAGPITAASPQVDVSRFPILQQESFAVLMHYFMGKPVSRESLRRLTESVRLFLRQADKPFSVVYTPEQDITDGRIQIVVIQSEFAGEVEVVGNRYFSTEHYLKQVRVSPGDTISRAQLDADLAWINRNPFRSATIEAKAGDEPGTTKLVMQVREKRPLRVFAGVNNTGTEMTQVERFNAGVNWGNAFGLGHQATAQWTSSWDFKTMRSLSGSYALDLPWRHTLSFTGAYSRTNGRVAPPFKMKGMSWQVAANYDLDLKSSTTGFSHRLTLGVDFKASDNNFTFATIPITDNLTHVVQARAAWSGSLKSKLGVTSLGATLTISPGGLTNRNKDQYFTLSRAGATADYVYLRFNGSQVIPLERLKSGLSWLLRGQLQFSPWGNLIGSEQFGAGGSTTVRGYEEGEVYKDNGFLLSHELRLPAWTFRPGHALRFYVFEDYANVWSTDELPGESAVDLHSAGVGLDYYMGSHASVRAAYGWAFTETGSSDSGDKSRLHIAASLSF